MKYENCMIAVDVDGTLCKPLSRTPGGKMIPEQNAQFLRTFYKEGGRVAICSGHSLSVCEALGAELEIPVDIVSSNGTVVKSGGKIISNEIISAKTVKEIQKLVYKIDPLAGFGIGTHAVPYFMHYRPDAIEAFRMGYKFMEEAFGNMKTSYNETKADSEQPKACVHADLNSFLKAARHANEIIVFSVDEKKNGEILTEILTKFGAQVDLANNFQVVSKANNKAAGINKLIKHLSINGTIKVIPVGDSKNDVPMVKEFNDYAFVIKTHKNDFLTQLVPEERRIDYVWQMQEVLDKII